jgi:Bacterial Ig-like domain
MRIRVVALLAVLAVATVSAQPSTRRATNIAALRAYPAFYHLRPIVVMGKVSLADNGEMRFADEAGSLRVVFKGSPPDGVSEVRGEFWDLGRMNADDPRLAGIDVQRTFRIDPEAGWPRPGQVTAIVASAIAEAPAQIGTSIRVIVLDPARFLDQKLAVTGQFAGRNLLGDLPDAPAKSRYDFVLRSADAAIWVTNLRPRGKDFELALDQRIDTGRWVQVSGVLQQGRGLQWLDGTGSTIALSKPPPETVPEAPILVAAAPAPEVVFSTPTQDETDVLLSTTIRIQFSRDIAAATLKNQVRITYDESEAQARGGIAPTPVEFTTQYVAAKRVLEIRLTKPLERFRTIQIELTNGILGTDQQPLVPWTLKFATGGS